MDESYAKKFVKLFQKWCIDEKISYSYFNLIVFLCNKDLVNIERIIKFVDEETIPVLTKDEKVILKRINTDFEAIRRGVNSKVLQLWSDDTGYVGIDIFDEELFSWIQPRRRI